MNPPPTYRVRLLIARAPTPPSARGFHAVAAPVLASRAATLSRVAPPMALKEPPTYTVSPRTRNTLAPARSGLGLGSQPVAAPVLASSAAMPMRACPPIESKSPPTYTVSPQTVNALT